MVFESVDERARMLEAERQINNLVVMEEEEKEIKPQCRTIVKEAGART